MFKLPAFKTSTYLLVTGVALLLPMSWLAYSYIHNSVVNIDGSKAELQGAELNELLIDLAGRTGELAILAAETESGRSADAALVATRIKEVSDTATEVNREHMAAVDALGLRSQWEKLSTELATVSSSSAATQLSDLGHELNEFSLKVADSAGITLDPVLESYYLGDVVATRLPIVIEQTRLASAALNQLHRADADIEQVRESASMASGVVLQQYEVMQRSVEVVGGSTAAMKGQYDSVIAASNALYKEASQKTMKTLQAAHPDLREVSAALVQWQTALHGIHQIHDPVSAGFQKIVNERFSSTRAALYTNLGLTALLLAIASFLSVLLVRAINKPITQALQAMDEMRGGKFDGLNLEQIGTAETRTLLSQLSALRDKLCQSVADEARLKEDIQGQMTAIGRVQAVIELDLDGSVRSVNENFVQVFGYSPNEINGKHHSLLTEPVYAAGGEHRAFWEKLLRGEYDAGQYKRITRSGQQIWVEASYNPVLDSHGKPFKIVAYATDITEQVLMSQQLQSVVRETQTAVKAVINGDVTQRIPMQGKTGELEELCGGVNSLLESTMRQVQLSAQLQTAVDETRKVVNSAIEGNLQPRIETAGMTGEIEALCAGVNSLVESMANLIRNVKSAAGEVQTGAEEISKGNNNLSQRTEDQASSLEETASSMEEMTSTVKQTADNAGQANQLAMAARQQAEKGGAVVGSAVKAMGGINEASKKIADIIGVIEEIAFQTNLLALNAAVEAARAGEQGRGFAVVATEVRNLAGRSATASKEIKTLIQDSVAKVEEGSKLVDESGKTLDEIVMAVKKVTDIVAEIAAASREQSSGIEQVNKAVMQMDDTTQQNAALVEQAAAASQAIVEQAQTLSEMIARYQVGDEGNAAFVPVKFESRSAAVTPDKERRAASRPWTKPAARTSGVPARESMARKSAVGADDTEWKEF